MTTMTTVANPLEIDLDQRRRYVAAGGGLGKIHAESGQETPSSEAKLGEQVVPEAIDVDYWKEEDGSGWACHSALLGVTAVAAEEPLIFPAMAVAVDEFWDILNAQYDTLSDELRNLLALRFQILRFNKQP